MVSPGFIDLLGQSEFNHLVDGRAASKLLQGVTTEVTGEGSSIAPVNDTFFTMGLSSIVRVIVSSSPVSTDNTPRGTRFAIELPA